jgi:hypothetical protein
MSETKTDGEDELVFQVLYLERQLASLKSENERLKERSGPTWEGHYRALNVVSADATRERADHEQARRCLIETLRQFVPKGTPWHRAIQIIDRLTSPPEKPAPVPTQGKPEHLQLADWHEYQKEHSRRVYYQNIVYAVCNKIDAILNRRVGHGIVCGTVESQTTQVQDAMSNISETYKVMNKEIEECHRLIDRYLKFPNDGTTSVDPLTDRLAKLFCNAPPAEPSAEAVAEQLARKVNELVPFFRADTSQFVRAFKPILDSFTRSKSERIRELEEAISEAIKWIDDGYPKGAKAALKLAKEIPLKSIQPEGKK